jgi:hypothetical protein
MATTTTPISHSPNSSSDTVAIRNWSPRSVECYRQLLRECPEMIAKTPRDDRARAAVGRWNRRKRKGCYSYGIFAPTRMGG